MNHMYPGCLNDVWNMGDILIEFIPDIPPNYWLDYVTYSMSAVFMAMTVVEAVEHCPQGFFTKGGVLKEIAQATGGHPML